MIKKYSIKDNDYRKNFYLNLKQISFLEVNYWEEEVSAIRISLKGSSRTLMFYTTGENVFVCDEQIQISQNIIDKIVQDFDNYIGK